MNVFRIRLALSGPLVTPLISGTIFGHLCWLRRYRDGEEALERWLEDFPRQPWLISSGMPKDRLPMPLLAPSLPPTNPGEMARYKQIKQLAWIPAERFFRLQRSGLDPEQLLADLPLEPDPWSTGKQLMAHNTIDRHTATTPERGGLHFIESWWPGEGGTEWDIYLQGAKVTKGELEEWFGMMGEQGFGKDASLGMGQFTARVEPVEARRFSWNGGNRRLSLAHGSLGSGMVAPRYRIHVHHGKLGGEWAQGCHSPFKRPLLLMAPGATFSAVGPGPFGALLSGVHAELPQVRHHACHLTLAFQETGQREKKR